MTDGELLEKSRHRLKTSPDKHAYTILRWDRHMKDWRSLRRLNAARQHLTQLIERSQ